MSKLDKADQVFKNPVEAIRLLNELWEAKTHDGHFIELADGRIINFNRSIESDIAPYQQNMYKYKYYMVTGCLVTEIINPPEDYPDIIARFPLKTKTK
jgi:hypothetical protein